MQTLPAFFSRSNVVDMSASNIHQGANPYQRFELAIDSSSLVKFKNGNLSVEAYVRGLMGYPVGYA